MCFVFIMIAFLGLLGFVFPPLWAIAGMLFLSWFFSQCD